MALLGNCKQWATAEQQGVRRRGGMSWIIRELVCQAKEFKLKQGRDLNGYDPKQQLKTILEGSTRISKEVAVVIYKCYIRKHSFGCGSGDREMGTDMGDNKDEEII